MQQIKHPSHYGGEHKFEPINIIDHFGLCFHAGNMLKYIVRAGKKYNNTESEDLSKALFYAERCLLNMRGDIYDRVKNNMSDEDKEIYNYEKIVIYFGLLDAAKNCILCLLKAHGSNKENKIALMEESVSYLKIHIKNNNDKIL